MPSNINWNLYKYFIAVYECGNLHRAGEMFAVSHSAVSQNIRELSTQLGVTLFKSTPKGMAPTAEATALYEKLKRAHDIIGETESAITAFTPDTVGKISFAMCGWFAKFYVNGFIKQFHEKFPRVELKMLQSDDIELLTTHKIDFFVGWNCLFDGTDIKQIDLLNRDIGGAFVTSKNFLRDKKLSNEITVSQLVTLPLLEQKNAFVKYWKRANCAPFREIIEIDSIDICLPMIKNGSGIGYFNELSLKEIARDPELVQLKITDIKLPPVRLVCAYNNLTRPARAFIDGFKQFCKAH